MGEDLLIWPRTPYGMYSVKSAYQLLATENLQAQAGFSNPEVGKHLWNGIWKLKVPNKVWHFLWHASSESLPINFNLYAKHILPDNSSSLCEEHLEDVLHCLWLCDHAKCVWLSDPTFSFPCARVFRSFGDLVYFILIELLQTLLLCFPWSLGVSGLTATKWELKARKCVKTQELFRV